MQLIISRKADTRFIEQMAQKAQGLKRADKKPELLRATVFTNDPLETRRKLDVVLSVRAMRGRVEVKLTSPVDTSVDLYSLGKAHRFGNHRYGFDLNIDASIEQFLDVVMEPVMVPSVADDSVAASA